MVRRKHCFRFYRILTSKNLKATYPRLIKWDFSETEIAGYRKMIELQKNIDLAAEKSFLATGRLDVDRIAVEVEKRQQYMQEHPIDLRDYEHFLSTLLYERVLNPSEDVAEKYKVDRHIYAMYPNASIRI